MTSQILSHEILVLACKDYIKERKWKLAFLAFDDIFIAIMAKNILFFLNEKQYKDIEAMKAAYYSALNYYFDRPDVAEEAKDQILLFEDYHKIISAGFREISCYEDKRFLAIDKSLYTDEQLRMLGLGIAAGVDITIYENPQFSVPQMYELLLSLVLGIDKKLIEEYAVPEFAPSVMRFYRKSLI